MYLSRKLIVIIKLKDILCLVARAIDLFIILFITNLFSINCRNKMSQPGLNFAFSRMGLMLTYSPIFIHHRLSFCELFIANKPLNTTFE